MSRPDPRAVDHVLRARARRAEEARRALRAPLEGRTLDTTPPPELSREELRTVLASTRPAFEGL